MENCTSKCLVTALIEKARTEKCTLEEAFTAMQDEIEAKTVYIAAQSLEMMSPSPHDEFVVFGVTVEFPDAVRLLADAMINGHKDGVEAWEKAYANLLEKTQSPPDNDERMIIVSQEKGYNPGKLYLRRDKLEQVLRIAQTQIGRKEAANQRQMTAAKDRAYDERFRDC